MKKKFGAFGAGQFSLETLVGGRPGTTIFQNPGGGGGGWGAGPGPAAPPWFIPPFYPGWSYWRYGLYWVMLACGSGVTPSLCLLALAV